jgi:NAD(P)-dependent dehydrogenase (short-subunit alcohol dehydrogenase family)
MESIAGRTALVTGAARGIGRATAELLDEEGARVVALDRDEEALRAAFGEGRVVPLVADLSDPKPAELAAEIWRAHGPVELLVNNVGISTADHFLELGEDDFDLVFNTNLRGPWFLTKEIVRRLLEEQRRGSIVFVSSLHDTHVRTFPHYSASKAGVSMLVSELAHELGPHGIRVNAVSPGIVRTNHNPATGADVEAYVREVVPMRRVGHPPDVAKVVAALLSEEWAAYVTGAHVPVDGGLGLHTWVRNGTAPAAQRPLGLLGRARELAERSRNGRR